MFPEAGSNALLESAAVPMQKVAPLSSSKITLTL
jgi:hypothetical protein